MEEIQFRRSQLLIHNPSKRPPPAKTGAMTGEKTKGRKRHIVTDAMGNLLGVRVHAANIHDTKGGIETLERALKNYPNITNVSADQGYRGTFRRYFEESVNIKVQISPRIKNTFEVQPQRWKVERTFAWFQSFRRLSKDYEIRIICAEKMCVIAHSCTLLKRF